MVDMLPNTEDGAHLRFAIVSGGRLHEESAEDDAVSHDNLT